MEPVKNLFITSFDEHDQTYIICMFEPKLLLTHKIAQGNLVITSEKGKYTSQILLEIGQECSVQAQLVGMHELHVTEALLREVIEKKTALRTGKNYTIQLFFDTPIARHAGNQLKEEFKTLKDAFEKNNLQNPEDVVT